MRIRFVDFKMHMLVCCSMLIKIMYLYLNFVLLLIRKKLYMIGLSSMIIISVCMIWNLFRANAKLFFFFGLSCYSISNYFCLSIVPFKFSINYICFWPNSFWICSMLITIREDFQFSSNQLNFCRADLWGGLPDPPDDCDEGEHAPPGPRALQQSTQVDILIE